MKIQSDLTKPRFYKKNIDAMKADTTPVVSFGVKKADGFLHISMKSDYDDYLFIAEMTNEEARFLAKSLLTMLGE